MANNLSKVMVLAPANSSVPSNPRGPSSGLQVGHYSLGTADPVDVLAQGEQEFLAMS